MTLSLRQLEIFEKVAATGSVTKASELLLITQSAVSMAVVQLEQQSGQPLFERTGRKLLLNDRGRLVLGDCRTLLHDARLLEAKLHGNDGELTGELVLGGSTTIGNYLLPQILGQFAHGYPATSVQLQVGNTRQIADSLEAGALDIAFVEGPCVNPGLLTIPWREDELVVVVGPEHPWKKTGYATVEMLAKAPWIVRETGSGTREVFETAMTAADINYSITLELGHTEAIKNGVAAGLGVSCLSRIAVARELQQGWLAAVKVPLNLHRTLTLLRRRRSSLTPLLAAFIETAGCRWDKSDVI